MKKIENFNMKNDMRKLNLLDINNSNKNNEISSLKNILTIEEVNLVNDSESKIENKSALQNDPRYLKKDKVSNIYINENIDYNFYQDKLSSYLSSTNSQQEKAVIAARFLAFEFPKLPYFWGGGHDYTKEEMIGINNEWGKQNTVKFGGSSNYVLGKTYTNSLDCSGFVSWCLTNAGFNLGPYLNNENYCLNTTSLKKIGPMFSITSDNVKNQVKLGDIGYKKGHVGIVVDVNDETNEATFAHMSGDGQGMNVTTISLETGLITKDNLGAMPILDGNGNQVNTSLNRVGQPLFTDIIFVPYQN